MKKIERRQELLINDVARIKQDLMEIKAVMENQSNIKVIRNEMRSLPKFKTVDDLKIFDIKYYKSPSEAQKLESLSSGFVNVLRERCMDWVICKVLIRELKELYMFKIC